MLCVVVRSVMIASTCGPRGASASTWCILMHQFRLGAKKTLRFFAESKATASIGPPAGAAAAACSFIMSVDAWDESSLDFVRRARIVSMSSSSSARWCVKVRRVAGVRQVRQGASGRCARCIKVRQGIP